MGVTIENVAKAAGVSTATVSNVLNGRRNVGEKTRERVLALCAEMGYQLPEGRVGRARLNKTILFNMSEFDRQFYLKIIHGISDYVYSRGYDLIVCTSRSGERFMKPSVTCGCVTLDMNCSTEMLARKASAEYPIVVMDRVMDKPWIKSLVVNNYDSMSELAQGLVDRGYRRFAFLGGLETDDTSERLQAVQHVLAKNHLRLINENYLVGDFKEKSGYQAARLLILSESHPDVLVCANDNMAIGAIKAFRESRLRVPEDIAVTGFDDSPVSEMMGLTTVAIPNYERGYLAVQFLLRMISGIEDAGPFKVAAKVKWRNTVLAKRESLR